MKACGKCRGWKSDDCFARRGDGRQTWCRECVRTYMRVRKPRQSRNVRNWVPRRRVTVERERELRRVAIAELHAMPVAMQRNSLAAALLDALDAMREYKTLCHQYKRRVRSMWLAGAA